MQEEPKKPAMPRLFRSFGITALILIVILWILLLFLGPDENNEAAQTPLPTENQAAQAPGPAEEHPEAYEFVTNYFDQIQRGNYDVLQQQYWQEGVEQDILAQCGSPLDDENAQGAEKLWRSCGYFNQLTVSVISIEENDSGYTARVQFSDQDGAPVGSTLHPEWAMGHELTFTNTADGLLRTGDWYFLN